MKKTTKYILGILLFLTLFVSGLIFWNFQQVDDQKERLTLYINEEEQTAFTYSAIEHLEMVEEKVITQYKNDLPSTERNLTVILLKDVLSQGGIDLTAITSVSVTALDGFSTTYTVNEVLSDDSVYLLLKEDGEALSSEYGSFSMVVPHDENSTRWVRQVYKINVQE